MEKERSAMSHLRQTAECIPIFFQMLRYGFFKSCSVAHDKRAVGHVAHSVQRTSNLFLPGPGLTTDQHSSKVRADPQHLQPQPFDLRTVAHDLETVAFGRRLFDKSARRLNEGGRIR